jgi:hypothetical protein
MDAHYSVDKYKNRRREDHGNKYQYQEELTQKIQINWRKEILNEQDEEESSLSNPNCHSFHLEKD